MAINQIDDGSVILTMTMGEGDAISLARNFSQGRLDDIDLFRIDFTQLMPKLEAALTEIEQAPDATRVSRARKSGNKLVSLSRGADPISQESRSSTPTKEKVKSSRNPLIPQKRRWGRKNGTIPSDQIGEPKRGHFTLVELLSTIAIGAVMIAIILPAIQEAREAARRSQCVNNLKQLALAVHNYEQSNSMLPLGAFYMSPTTCNGWKLGHSFQVGLLPYMEQGEASNAFNYSLHPYQAENSTVMGLKMSSLWCPSDGEVSQPVIVDNPGTSLGPCSGMANGTVTPAWKLYHTSYSGNAGMFPVLPNGPEGVDPNYTAIVGQADGAIIFGRQVTLASITDGTSNTMLIGEHALSKIQPEAVKSLSFIWCSGSYHDTMFTTLHPINPHNNLGALVGQRASKTSDGGNPYTGAASSRHPGGVNFAMCDGSVRFIKDTISAWQYNPSTLLPNGVTRNTIGSYNVTPGTQMGIYQALSTRNGGEVVDPDSY